MIINEEKVKQIMPLDPEMQVSELLSIALDVWKDIASYLSVSDRAALRLVCYFFFRAVLSSPPAWEQWVSVNDLKLFQQKNKEFGWGDRPIYGVFLPHHGIIPPKWFASLSPPLPTLDVSARQPQPYFNVYNLPELSKDLPKELKFNFFPEISEQYVKYYFKTYPHLHLHLEGTNILWWACYFGWKNIVKEIINQINQQTGPYALLDINKGNGFYSPLAIAAQKNHIEILKLLIKQGEDINQCCESGTTPLIIAIEQGHVDVVKFLLKEGAKVNERDKNNQTPLTISYFYHNEKDKNYQVITKLLIAYGANCYQQNTDEKIELLESWIRAYNQNNRKFFQKAHEASTSIPKFYISTNATISSELYVKTKQWIYELSTKIGRGATESRMMAHHTVLWIEYIALNNFSFSLQLCPFYIQLFCLLLIDHYIDGSDELRERCPTKNLVDLTTNIYKKHEVYRLRSEIQGLNLRQTLTTKTPYFILENILIIFPQHPLIRNLALILLDSCLLQFHTVSLKRDAIAAAALAVARFWVLENPMEMWPQEYTKKLNMPLDSFKEEYDQIYQVASDMCKINIAKKKTRESKISHEESAFEQSYNLLKWLKLGFKPLLPKEGLPDFSEDHKFEPYNSPENNTNESTPHPNSSNVQVSNHRQNFFNESNAQNGNTEIKNENDVISDPKNTHK